MAEIKGEEKKQQSFFQKVYVRFVDMLQRTFFKGGAGLYEDATKEQLAHYLKSHAPDGEIIFLAADPDCKIKGVGTALLHALEEKEIVLEMPKGKVPLRCFVYSKRI